nr:MAG TPA: hypothetical protein [Siphovirus LN-2020-1]FAA02853.1 MAG TPA: hypothetical protein [Siphovirus LN-2020-1]
MSSLFIAFGFISFVMFLYTVYSQARQIKALKKAVRRQRHLLKTVSNPLPQDADDVEKQLEEDWADIEKLFRHNSTMK